MVVALYDFEAQGDDELSVSENDQLVLVEKENDEWWKVQNASGAMGVVPAAYVEPVEQDADDSPTQRIPHAPAAPTPGSGYEMMHRISSIHRGQPRGEARSSSGGSTGSGRAARSGALLERDSSVRARGRKPNPMRVRTWFDRTGQYKVDAELLGVRNGVLRLHKVNGMVIDVAVEKMSRPDLEFLEEVTGKKFVRRDSDGARPKRESDPAQRRRGSRSKPGANFDWFDFFLAAGVDVDNCTRYATAFERDSICLLYTSPSPRDRG